MFYNSPIGKIHALPSQEKEVMEMTDEQYLEALNQRPCNPLVFDNRRPGTFWNPRAMRYEMKEGEASR